MESDYVDYNICCLMPETSWLLFALMKADSVQLWQLYICTHVHRPSHAGRRAVTTICFCLSGCCWANGGEVCGFKAVLLVSEAGRGLLVLRRSSAFGSAVSRCSAFKTTHWGFHTSVSDVPLEAFFSEELLRWQKDLSSGFTFKSHLSQGKFVSSF